MMTASSTFLTRLRIVSINDVYELANLPRLQTFLTKLSPKPSAIVLAGDFLSPSTLSSIDGGRGMVATLRTVGVTHVSLGNHEQDLQLDILRERLEDLSRKTKLSKRMIPSSSPNNDKASIGIATAAVVLNSNMQQNLPPNAEWMRLVTKPYSLVESPCGNVKIALLGFLSDEPGIFRDNTFKSVPIQKVLETYTEIYNQLVTVPKSKSLDYNINDNFQVAVDLLVPLTHESIVRDKELAQHMLSLHGGPGLIIGGHEHDPYHEIVTKSHHQQQQQQGDEDVEDIDNDEDNNAAIHILKSGMEARNACLIDLVFEVPAAIASGSDSNGGKEKEQSQIEEVYDDNNFCNDESKTPRLVRVENKLINLTDLEPSPFAQKIVDKHMSVVKALEDEIIVNADSVVSLPNDVTFSSKRSRFQQTTIGSVFCQMIKEELEDCDVAMVNGATIKGDMTYDNGQMTYAELKSELPFPTKIVTVEMTRRELYKAIYYSRTAMEDGIDLDAEEVPRRGYLQVDFDCDQEWMKESLADANFDDNTDDNDDGACTILKVALPRNLLNGFSKIKPLMDVGKRLKQEGRFPGNDDFVPALDLIVRHACKNRWLYILAGKKKFDQFDLNDDGMLDRHEIKTMMIDALGYEPADFFVDDMIGSIDLDENGVIDLDEFDLLLAQMQRENNEYLLKNEKNEK